MPNSSSSATATAVEMHFLARRKRLFNRAEPAENAFSRLLRQKCTLNKTRTRAMDWRVRARVGEKSESVFHCELD